jgi:oligosaccharide repeat unit polymerase
MLHIGCIYISAHFVSTYINSDLFGFENFPGFVLVLGMSSLCIGHLVFKFRKKYFDNINTDYIITSRRLLLVVAIFLSMIVYHYLVGGIPLFSENILFSRFESTSSGLFGVPGRFNLYGGFILLFLCFSSYAIKGQAFKKILLFSFIVLLISLLFKGSKGTLIHFLVAYLICRSSDNYKISKTPKKTFKVLLCFALIVLPSFVYISNVHIESGTRYTNLAEVIFMRIFELSGKGYFNSVTNYIETYGFGYGMNLFNDTITFFNRLFDSDTNLYYTSEKVSALTTGTSIDQYLVPQEINMFGYSYMEFGIFGVIFSGVLFGYIYGRTIYRTQNSNNVMSLCNLMFFQLYLFLIFIKGNIALITINMGISYLIFMFIFNLFLRRIKI